MRIQSSLLGASVVCVLGLMFAPVSWGQAKPEAKGTDDQSAARQADDSKGSMETETLHGIVSAITREGEIALDYKNKRAVEVDAAFLTVVASPVRHEQGQSDRTREQGQAERKENATAGQQQHNGAGRHRYNVYQVWISPKTKVCECAVDMASRTAQGRPNALGDKKECGLDQLEVGDHVQIEFVTQREDSEAKIAHQTEKMSQTHGRHRTHIGYAKEISIMVPKDGDRTDDSRSRGREGRNDNSDKK